MKVDFEKYADGLVPAIIQHDATGQVLMLGYMNAEALEQTRREGMVTFFSRSKQRLWTKGETSGYYLLVKSIEPDCDRDALLIRAEPLGPTCHLGTASCFGEKEAKGFLYELEQVIAGRIEANDERSYTNLLFRKGINKVAQKVGEEAVELVIEAKDDNEELFKNEAADLLYHLLILLRAKNLSLAAIEQILLERHKP
jgi:phosphoribosyl-ATP pyrophosphohydrolase/phosphoribosyl-AMP cyclohydrolase